MIKVGKSGFAKCVKGTIVAIFGMAMVAAWIEGGLNESEMSTRYGMVQGEKVEVVKSEPGDGSLEEADSEVPEPDVTPKFERVEAFYSVSLDEAGGVKIFPLENAELFKKLEGAAELSEKRTGVGKEILTCLAYSMSRSGNEAYLERENYFMLESGTSIREFRDVDDCFAFMAERMLAIGIEAGDSPKEAFEKLAKSKIVGKAYICDAEDIMREAYGNGVEGRE